MTEIVARPDDSPEVVLRLCLGERLQFESEDAEHGVWTKERYLIERVHDALEGLPGVEFPMWQVTFARLVEQVSVYLRPGSHFRPAEVEDLNRHTLMMKRCLVRHGWTVKHLDNQKLELAQESRKVTLSCKCGKGLLLAMAIFTLFLRTIR